MEQQEKPYFHVVKTMRTKLLTAVLMLLPFSGMQAQEVEHLPTNTLWIAHMGGGPYYLRMTPKPPGKIFGHWKLKEVEQKESQIVEIVPYAPIPKINQAFFCRFEDRIGKKLGFGIDFGTEVKQ